MNYAVLTSGGDAPGMNYAIWYLGQRIQNSKDDNLFVVKHGFRGLGNNEIVPFQNNEYIKNILTENKDKGGSCIYSSRSPEWMISDFRQQAKNNLIANGIDRLIVIGGNGSEKGVADFMKDFPTFLIPATIDNDVKESDYTLGVDSAVISATNYILKIGELQKGMERGAIFEVMGKHDPMLTLKAGFLAGCDKMVINSLDENPLAREFVEKNDIFDRIIETKEITKNIEPKFLPDNLKDQICNHIIANKIVENYHSKGINSSDYRTVAVLENEPGAKIDEIAKIMNKSGKDDLVAEIRPSIIGYEQRAELNPIINNKVLENEDTASVLQTRDIPFAEECVDMILKNNEIEASGLLTGINNNEYKFMNIPENTPHQ